MCPSSEYLAQPLFQAFSQLSLQTDLTRDMLSRVELTRENIDEGILTVGRYAFDYGFVRPSFRKFDILYLASPTACLNAACINGCAAILHASYMSSTSKRCAIFSTYDLVNVHQRSNEDIWQSIHATYFWLKDIWIIPIHRPDPGHWVLCIAYVQSRKLLLFDSLGKIGGWRQMVW
jgi:hypothetical protein